MRIGKSNVLLLGDNESFLKLAMNVMFQSEIQTHSNQESFSSETELRKDVLNCDEFSGTPEWHLT